MSLIDDFDELKSGLTDKWLNYYEANQSWINSTGLHSGQGYNPNYYFVIGVVATLEPKATELIYFLSTRLRQNVDTIAQTLGLAFDPIPVLQTRAEAAKNIQEAKLLTSGDNDSSEDEPEEVKVDDLGLDILRKEASQLSSNNE